MVPFLLLLVALRPSLCARWISSSESEVHVSEEQPNSRDMYDPTLYEECTDWLTPCESDWECCKGLVCRWRSFAHEYRCETAYQLFFDKWTPPEKRNPPPPSHVPPPPRFWRLRDFIPVV